MIWIAILLMTAIVFGSRYLFLTSKLNFTLHPHLRGLLKYSGPAIMTAIWCPIVFIHDGKLPETALAPYLIGAVIACACAAMTRHVLLTIGLGSAAFVTSSWLLG